MSSSHLEADVCAFASTIRTRLHRHWSHRFKVCAYRWWNTAFIRGHSLSLALLGSGREARASADQHRRKLSAIVDAFNRKSPEGVVASGDGGEDLVVTRVSR